jgi:hypothetical protein
MTNHKRLYIYFCSAILTFFLFPVLTVLIAAADDMPGFPGGIDSGASSAYTTTDGVTFEADYGRTGGIVRSSSGEIRNTENDTLYHSRVVAPIGEVVTYLVTPPNGVAQMDIIGHFNEHYHQRAGARLIDVTIRCPGSAEPWNTGVKVESELDVFSEAGGANTALMRNWGLVDVSGGQVEIMLSASATSPDAALISAIEFADPPPIISLPGGIDSGASSAYTTADSVTFEADYGRTGGIVRRSSGEILNTENDTLYHSRVVAPIREVVTYLVTAPNGVTQMDIIGHFNEHYHQRAGARLIDVTIRCPGSAEPWNTGVKVESELDVFSEAGGKNTALMRNWGPVDVSGGQVEIMLSASATSPDAALISAIEFAAAGSSQGDLLAPKLLTPEEGDRMDNGCPDYPPDPIIWDFSWSSVPSADNYEISFLVNGSERFNQIVTTPEFNYICYEDSDEIPLCQIDIDSENWSWRVRAGSGGTWSDWSDERSLDIEDIDYNCAVADPYGIGAIELDPSSPASLTPGTEITISFRYYAPYAGATISVIPSYQNNPLSETAYSATTDELYTDGYNGGDGQAYLTVEEEGIQVDQILLWMPGCAHELISVDYTFTSDSTDN